MFKRSIITKYIVLGLIILTLIASFTILSFWFSNRIKGDARRINLAGRERMLSFQIAWLLSQAMNEKDEARIKTLNYIKQEMALFEDVLYTLKDGNEKYELEPLPHRSLIGLNNNLIDKWNSEVKPTLIKATEGSPDAYRKYNEIIHGYVNEIDNFVKNLDETYKKEIRLYENLRLAVLGLSVLTFFGIILYVKGNLVRPMRILRKGAVEIGKGNFDVRVDVKSRDEIGVLAKEFNKMSHDLKRLYENLKNEEEEKRKLEAQLFQSQKMEAIGTLTAGIAHDFKNMLSGIIGFSEIAREEASGTVKEKIDKVLKISAQAVELTKQILIIGRKILPEQKAININKLIEGSINMFNPLLGDKTKIVVLHQTDLPVVEADPSQITQVLMNLMVNARDSMPDGGVIKIKTEGLYVDEEYCRHYSWAKTGNYVSISVLDNGNGIPEKIRDRIFEPFFTTKDVGKGTGLGLAVTYSIVKNHGGWINFYSEIGKGTEFRVYLPAIDIAVTKEGSSLEEILPRGTETVLLVDDEQMMRSVGESILLNLGYRVITASDGEEALAIYRERCNEISLVILDKVMPEMGGIQIYRLLKEINPQIKVILSSGHVIDEKENFKELGISDFLDKPFRMSEMAKMVRNTIDT
jgi:signal transduction histidine kinase/CheY-like chemotaxis protein